MTEKQIKEIGWKLVKSYKHDQFNTNRYELGCMEIEFTYEGSKLCNVDLTIAELNCMQIKIEEVIQLSEILGKHPK
jgi:hypothetical protein